VAKELLHAVDAACAAFGDSVAIVDERGPYTYAQLSADAAAIAGALTAAGACADEPVLVMVSNRARDWASFLGAWRAGCVAAPMHRTTAPLALAGILGRTAARFVLDGEPGGTKLPDEFAAGASAACGGRLIRLERPAPPPRPLLADGAFIIFTSGSTGLPKGAVVSHQAWEGKLTAIDSILHFDRSTRALLVLQITFSYGIWVSLLCLTRGGTLHVHEKYDPGRMLAALDEDAITAVALVPTMLRALLARRDQAQIRQRLARIDRANRPSQLLTGGESLGAALHQAVAQLFPRAALFDIYGLTETATSDFFLKPEDHAEYLGCIGRPTPGVRFRIADARGEPVAEGENGELQILTRFIMNGYLDEPELTQQAFHGAYFRTGDIARSRGKGVVELAGRAKELISRAANKISPLEIEQVFLKHPAVAEAMVAGIPDALIGERIHILIIPRHAAAPAEDELRRWASQWLEKFKMPDVFHFGTALPLGRTGKADRGRLRELVLSGAALA
jgi:long-chain acyl-CoA synthetase